MIDPKISIRVYAQRLTADLLTPVSIYLNLRDHYTDPVLLESNESRDNEHYFSFIGLETMASFQVNNGTISEQLPGQMRANLAVQGTHHVPNA
ncbi:MAG: hypothetical protein AAFQ37_11245, partial [Bacteroidota bacterium]